MLQKLGRLDNAENGKLKLFLTTLDLRNRSRKNIREKVGKCEEIGKKRKRKKEKKKEQEAERNNKNKKIKDRRN